MKLEFYVLGQPKAYLYRFKTRLSHIPRIDEKIFIWGNYNQLYIVTEVRYQYTKYLRWYFNKRTIVYIKEFKPE